VSYPPPPPNDPYGNDRFGKRPTQPYGYPQQQPPQPQPAGQPNYGYPQVPGYPAQGPYGQPAVPTRMPSKVTAVRVMMFIAGPMQAIVCLIGMIGVGVASKDMEEYYTEDLGLGLGIIFVLLGLCLLHAVIGVALAANFGKGGAGVRTGSIVWASVVILLGLAAIVTIGVVWVALGIVCVVLLAHRESTAWFARPRC
jgi:hypothetical protein